MKNTTHIVSLILATILFANISLAQAVTQPLWSEVSESAIVQVGLPFQFAPNHRTYLLSFDDMKNLLQSAPMERTLAAKTSPLSLNIPTPDGTFQRFAIVEVQIMEPGLAAQYPEIHTYAGQGIDDPTATIRLDVTMAGFHAMVRSSDDDYFIDPHNRGDPQHYVLHAKKNADRSLLRNWSCTLEADPQIVEELRQLVAAGILTPTGPTLRTYRLACAADGEYTAFFGGTVAAGHSAIVTAVNRVDGVYETEFAIRMVLVANNDTLIFTNSTTDPYTNNNGSTMLTQNQTTIDARIGSANYDIGHVFSTGGGGIAGLGVVCRAGQKAHGVTGLTSPTGDDFYIDYVAHEMGHEFGANHPFNSITSNCGGGNRNASTAYEPGSGTTIMAYAGICGADDIQPHSDAYFHTISFDEIVAYTNTGLGNGCPVQSATGNSAPTSISVPTGGFTIPISTPFALTGSATDPNGDPLTYCWEEFDLGPSGSPNSPSGNAPIFRSFNPGSSPSRTFPQQSDLLNNTQTIGEILPTYTRSLAFRLTARDNRSGGGGVDHSSLLTFNVNAGAGPFLVTSPNTAVSWGGNSTQTVTWNVANTSSSPVSCANVNILLSTDGGVTFPTVLAASTPNDGSQAVTIPNTATTTARIKVEAVGNIFFDLSNVNFTITASTLAAPTPVFPSDNATQQPVSLTIRWNTVATATSYRLQVGTDSTFAGGLVVNDSTLTDTSRAVSGLNTNTKYFWRVNAKNGSGTSAYSSLRRFTTITPPAAVILVSPSDNAIQQPVSLTLKWNTASTAISYRLQVGTDSTFAGGMVVNDSTLTDTSRVVSGLNTNTKYFWRVNAKNAAGYGAASSLRRFTTITPPAAVILVSPSDNATQQPVSLTLKWNTASTATSYRLQVGTDSTFAGGLVANDSTLTDTSSVVSGLNTNTKYFWRVNAKNAAGYGAASSLRRFTTIAPPAVVTLVFPADNATGQPISLTLRWNTVSVATSYRLEVSTDSTFAGGVVVDDSTLTDTSRVVSGLNTNTKYFWRATARNAAGSGPTSSLRRFTTIAPPAAVVLVSPADNATGQLLSLTLRWRTVSGATAYALQLSPDSTFVGGLIVNDPTITDTSYLVSGLATNTQYSWRVRGSNIAGNGVWSLVWKFTTTFPPTAVVLISPADNAQIPVDSVVMIWRKAEPSATTYWFERSSDSTFTSAIIDSTITDTTFVVRSLADLTSYWWRVKAKNIVGWGAFSAARKFGTAFQITVCVSLQASWNLISLPVRVADDSSTHVFPQCPGCAFSFTGALGYQQDCRLQNGVGYWLKCSSGTPCLTGSPVLLDSIPVVAGWNLVGSISVPVDVSTIVTVPQGIIGSEFYTFDNGYNEAPVLQPGVGYWVKTSQAGVIVLDGTGAAPPVARSHPRSRSR